LNLPTLDEWTRGAHALTGAATAAGIAVVLALAVHLVLFAGLKRITRLSAQTADEEFVRRLHHPARWSLVAVAVSLAAEANPALAHIWDMVARFVVPALLGWTVFALVKAFAVALESRAELASDEMTARSRKTRIAILSRTAGFVIVLLTVALMLFSVPGVRSIGATLLASAGLATLAVGAAAQPALKSLIAGLQMAITEPIRIGDLVVIDNQSGRVEDIRMSYVVIRTGDERRVVVPTTRFLDQTFENWTRVTGGLTGSVILPVKPCPPIAPIRAAYLAALAAHADWDQRTGALHVADVRVDSVDLKLVMSAADPAALDRLRMAIRETMLEWLREHMPDGLCKSG
jgi:small-conductance mechanosensitive channel